MKKEDRFLTGLTAIVLFACVGMFCHMLGTWLADYAVQYYMEQYFAAPIETTPTEALPGYYDAALYQQPWVQSLRTPPLDNQHPSQIDQSHPTIVGAFTDPVVEIGAVRWLYWVYRFTERDATFADLFEARLQDMTPGRWHRVMRPFGLDEVFFPLLERCRVSRIPPFDRLEIPPVSVLLRTSPLNRDSSCV